ncbi:MAG: hypothetical protein SF052_21410 [Bacteroidia bacterium]|nr:hypothetical protein [Bacteroidia bacterium]
MYGSLRYIVAFGLYVFFQVAILNDLTLFHVATPFVFLVFLFTLPFSLPVPIVYIITFITGFVIDVFSDHTASGLHIFASLMAVAARSRIAIFVSTANYRSVDEITFRNQTAVWFVWYLLPLIFIHHLTYFFLESFSFQYFFLTMLKVVSSTLYTFFISYILCYLFYQK